MIRPSFSDLNKLNVDIVLLLRTFFLLLSSTAIIINAIPALRGRFVAYGPRTVPSSGCGNNNNKSTENDDDTLDRVFPGRRALDSIASWRVPHRYFLHFYVVSVLSSLFWAEELLRRGHVFMAISSPRLDAMTEERRSQSMTIDQVLLCWTLMTIQGSRRLWESFALAKPSYSKMWFVHWGLGIGFYIAMGISIWIEGTPRLRAPYHVFDHIRIVLPSLKTLIFLPVFVFASGIQHDCHRYLASLKEYKVPNHPAFERIICPHYTAECVVYISLAFLAAPRGQLVNKTLLTALAFVVSNLGISAQVSKEWYENRFGRESVLDKWRMIPLIY